MLILINGEEKHVPSDLSTITLGKFIEWYQYHGRKLDETLSQILDKEYDDELQLEFAIDDHLMNEAIAWYSFFTGCDFATIRNTDHAPELLAQYKVIRYLLKESEKECKNPETIQWNGDEWEIQNHVVDPKSNMTFNEIITSKEAMRQLQEVGAGKWHSMLYLCCIFLRKKGEPFKDEFIHEGSERLELFKTLPLNYAMMVGFFLTNCVSIWQNTSQFSAAEAEEI